MSDLDTSKKSGSLDYTLATFVYLLHDEGHSCTNQEIERACVAIKEAANKAQSQRVAQMIAKILTQSFGKSPDNSVISITTTTMLNLNATQLYIVKVKS